MTDEHDKLYIAVRSDLSPGLATAQAVHAAFLFATQHPDLVGPWMRNSQYLVIVAVPDEIALIGLSSKALEAGIAVSTWHEPDMDDEKTAVALEAGDVARRLCSNLPLYGKPRMEVAA